MNGWVDGWTDGRIDEMTDGKRVVGWVVLIFRMNRCTDKLVNNLMQPKLSLRPLSRKTKAET